MDRALFLAMSGAKQDMHALQVRANNLANVSTTGFRADLAQARAMQAYGEGLPTRVFSMTERPGYNFAQGSTITTARDLDVAVKGRGWIAVQNSAGEESFTREGNLSIDELGFLRNSHGHRVQGENGAPIVVPLPIAKVEIAENGIISVLPKDAPPEAMEEVGRIRLVNPDLKNLFKDKDGLFKTIDPAQVVASDASVKLVTGALEGSNVNAIGEMTSLIDLQRQFELQVKLMKTAEEMDQASSSLMRMG